MPAPKRNKLQREQDLNTLTKLYFKHVPQVEIARQLKISQGQVSQDLKKLVQRWEAANLHEIDRYKAEQLDRINMMEEELWDAWELSKTTAKKVHSKTKSGRFTKDPLLGTVEAGEGEFWRAGVTEEETRGGDMQYFTGIQWCCQERAKILGLYAPKKVANTDPSGDREAGISAREELMGMISSIANKLAPELAKNVTPHPVTGQVIDVEDFTADAENSKEVPNPYEPQLAKLLKKERKRRVTPLQLTEGTDEIQPVIDVESAPVIVEDETTRLAKELAARLENN